MSLSELKIGDKAKITSIEAKGPIKNRLSALGLSCGAEVTLKKQSAAKATLLACVGSSVIALRKEEAKTIKVQSV